MPRDVPLLAESGERQPVGDQCRVGRRHQDLLEVARVVPIVVGEDDPSQVSWINQLADHPSRQIPG
jgi:hypothetical protein